MRQWDSVCVCFQMGLRCHGGWTGTERGGPTGLASNLASSSAPAAWRETASTRTSFVTVTQTETHGKIWPFHQWTTLNQFQIHLITFPWTSLFYVWILDHGFTVFNRATDTGFVSFKDHLPMTGMVVGATHRTGSLVTYRVGPLQCSGDRKC